MQPVKKDFGAHGRFDRGAIRVSLQAWLGHYRLAMLIGTAALAFTGLLLFWRAQQEPFLHSSAQTSVLTPLTMSRSIARLLVGVLLFAQLAVAAYACPVMLNGSANRPGHSAFVGTVSAMHSSGMEASFGGMDSDLPNLCFGHCQFGHQNTDSTSSSPTPPVAMLTSLYTLPSLEQSAGLARPLATASGPPSLADPPHSILHCCFRF